MKRQMLRSWSLVVVEAFYKEREFLFTEKFLLSEKMEEAWEGPFREVLERQFSNNYCSTSGGVPDVPKIKIFQWILSSLHETEGYISSIEIADLLVQSHDEVILAMWELYVAFTDMFELKYDLDNGLFETTILGKLFLGLPLLEIAENGLPYETFRRIYPSGIRYWAVSEKWVTIKKCREKNSFLLFPGPNKIAYEVLYKLLEQTEQGIYITPYSKRKLINFGFAVPGPLIPIFRMKKTSRFPINRNDVSRVWFIMIHIFLISSNMTAMASQ